MFTQEQKERLVRLCMTEAELAGKSGEDAFGALLVDKAGAVVFSAHCTKLQDSDRLAHAEINLLRHACKTLHTQSLEGHILVTNAEPCSMCMSAAIKTKIFTFIYGTAQGRKTRPSISAEMVRDHTANEVTLVPNILAEETREQIEYWRNTNSAGG